jgi:hypothetical protein
MKRTKRLTKRERKATQPARAAGGHEEQHIHCISCGRHLDPREFDDPMTAKLVTCQHGSSFPSCVGCETASRLLLEAHDRSGQPVKTAAAWH